MAGKKRIVYWVATLFVSVTALVAGTMDVLRMEPLYGIVLHLGFPAWFAPMLGTWKILGAVVLVTPRHPLLKEWAYAGMFFDYTTAVVAHAATGDAPSTLIGPLFSIGALIASRYTLGQIAAGEPHPISRRGSLD
jgi:hypothetical protein